MSKVRVRIAPSPTGSLHVGTARTALFNWLFAKKHGGQFLVRLEDTDKTRSQKKYEEDILASLAWLGLSPDEEIVRQSEHFDKYRAYAERLVQKGIAFKEAGKVGGGEAIILKHTGEDLAFEDLIRGQISFAKDELKDMVLIKGDGSPAYNFSVVVDDHEMNISHVIRGEDHISNTPKQIAIYRALEWETPQFGHIPLILAPDKSKLSKRHGAVSVTEYKKQGYLPEAFLNFMALLGWNPGTEQEIFSRSELEAAFELEKVHKGGAVFNKEKLDWFNREWMRRLPVGELLERAAPFVPKGTHLTEKHLEIVRDRLTTLADIYGEVQWLEKPDYRAPLLAWKSAPADTLRENLETVQAALEKLPEQKYTPSELENALMPLADARGRGETLWPLRVALSGKDKSPSPFELLALLGKEESLKRVAVGIRKLGGSEMV